MLINMLDMTCHFITFYPQKIYVRNMNNIKQQHDVYVNANNRSHLRSHYFTIKVIYFCPSVLYVNLYIFYKYISLIKLLHRFKKIKLTNIFFLLKCFLTHF